MDETIFVILKVLFDFALEVWFSINVIDKGCFSEAFSFKPCGGRRTSSGLNRKPKNPLFSL